MDHSTKVLVLDDEPIVGERLKPYLERAGFHVDTCISSLDALTRLKNQRYGILVTDLKMKGPDGMAVLRQAMELQPGIKVVVITGFATDEMYREAIQSGAVEFIAKPFKLRQLRELLISLDKENEQTNRES